MLYVVGPVAARCEEKEKRCETNWFVAKVCVTGESTEKKGEEKEMFDRIADSTKDNPRRVSSNSMKAGTTLVAHQIDNDALDFPTSFENPINVQKKVYTKQASETIGAHAIISSIYLQKNGSEKKREEDTERKGQQNLLKFSLANLFGGKAY
ncbi:hypothetical protein G5I_07010 [Acromyrmex echinatior]|uniref:Uncharacterized protein n=1 Tax=Acromyrmex echinatior TaxID=103372 RepID=F4WMM7_ACREC|nr:hypothetical protein G5I_07010 [Acromyrmex echinatior]